MKSILKGAFHMNRRVLPLLSALLSLFIVFSCISIFSFCSEDEKYVTVSSTIVEYSDGSWDQIVVTQSEPGRNRSTITGHVTTTRYSSTDELVWRVKLTGTFTYNGVVSSCTDAYTTVTFYQSGWSVSSEQTEHHANVASNSVVLVKKILGITLLEMYVNQTLTCDKDGNLS